MITGETSVVPEQLLFASSGGVFYSRKVGDIAVMSLIAGASVAPPTWSFFFVLNIAYFFLKLQYNSINILIEVTYYHYYYL
jgi:hypothetical protein